MYIYIYVYIYIYIYIYDLLPGADILPPEVARPLQQVADLHHV